MLVLRFQRFRLLDISLHSRGKDWAGSYQLGYNPLGMSGNVYNESSHELPLQTNCID